MKVGVFVESATPERGGVYTFLDDLFQAFAELSTQSQHTFVVLGWPNVAGSRDRLQFVSLQRRSVLRLFSPLYRRVINRLGRLQKRVSTFGLSRAYHKPILQSGAQVLWCFGHYAPLMDIPHILTVWDLQHLLQPFFPEVSARGEWEAREKHYAVALRRATMIVTGTARGKWEIERFYQVPPERIKVLPLPTPQFTLDALKDGVRYELNGYPVRENYLFYPAQFWSHKNHAGLLQAVRVLRDRWDIHLPVLLVGSDKGNQAYIRQLVADLGLTGQVHFLGFVSRRDLIALYQNAFALVYPTFFGPDNLPPLEAFALGCPVVASNVPGALEQFGDAALLVDPKNPAEIAGALKSLNDDPALRETLVQRGRARALRWTPRDYIRGMFTILDEFEPVRQCWGQ